MKIFSIIVLIIFLFVSFILKNFKNGIVYYPRLNASLILLKVAAFIGTLVGISYYLLMYLPY